jgi:glycosyltransferase involved in cell wall biosynthesis
MLSIALFSECYYPMRNGVAVSVASFARILAALGHQVTVFTAQHPDSDDEETNVFRFPAITLPYPVVYPLAIPIATGKARKLLKYEHYDVLHSNSAMLMGQVALTYHRRRHLPLVFTYHTMIEEYTHYVPLPEAWVRRSAIHISRDYANSADHIITPTRHVADRLRQYRVVQPITVIPTGVDIDLIDQIPDGAFRAAYAIPADVPLLAYAGRLAREKNVPRLLTAFHALHHPDAHLVLMGGGPDEAALREQADALGLEGRVIFTGALPRERLIQGLREADLFVFASTTETQGLVLGEAMACRVPVVAVAAMATRELITSGVEGLLVDDADEPFADALHTLLDDAPRRVAMRDAARRRAESVSAAHSTARLLDVYAAAMQACQPGPLSMSV